MTTNGHNCELHRLATPVGSDRLYGRSPFSADSSPEVDSRSSSPVSDLFDPEHRYASVSENGPSNEPSNSHSAVLAAPDDDGQTTPDVTVRTAPWGIHWRSPSLMVLFLVAGIAFAVGHHFHYQSLAGTEVSSQTSQQWAIRIGTGLAFLCKASLAASVGTAYTQRLWVTVKKRSMRLEDLDNAFSLTTEPLSFFSWRLLAHAKMLCILAACMWCIPIVATITPATLSIRQGMASNTTMKDVPRPSYDNELWTVAWVNFEGVGRIESSSAAVDRLVAATTSSIAVLPLNAPFPNSTYTLDFYAPAIKCESLSVAVANNSLDLGEADSLAQAWDASMQDMSWSANSPLYTANTTGDLSMYGHLFVNTNGPSGQNYSCHQWNASYTVAFESRDGLVVTSVRRLVYVKALSIPPMKIANEYAPGEIAAWAVFSALSRVLVAQFGFGSTGSLSGAGTDIFKSGLPACPEIVSDDIYGSMLTPVLPPWMCRSGSVPRAIEDLSHNVTLSLMTSALFSNSTAANVTASVLRNYYVYAWHNLLTAYAVAVAVALACATIGACAYAANGYSASSSFSSILFTTRNPDLDSLARGRCLGEHPMPADVKATVLRYGLLQSGNGDYRVPHAGFGLHDTVNSLVRGQVCS